MSKHTNPLDKVQIAAPCSAVWNEMHGDDRKRYCSECKLNVYNLSAMTRREAENFLINSEGRICVKFYRRSDGTVLTQDCPVGWKIVKRRMSKIISALFSMCFGVIGGLFAFHLFEADTSNLLNEIVVESNKSETTNNLLLPVGDFEPKDSQPKKSKIKKNNYNQMVLGRVESIRRLEDEPVKLWIK
jgi:hypothetical protein